MTNKEAIETINIAIAEVEWDYPMDYTVAFEMAVDALEKQIPVKPSKSGLCGCGSKVFKCFNYCPICGQAIDK